MDQRIIDSPDLLKKSFSKETPLFVATETHNMALFGTILFNETKQKQYCLYSLSHLILTSCLLNCCPDMKKSVPQTMLTKPFIIALNARRNCSNAFSL